MKYFIYLGLLVVGSFANAQLAGTPVKQITSKQVAKQLRKFLVDRVSARFPNGQPCQILMTFDPLASESYLMTMSDGRSYRPKQSIRLYPQTKWSLVRNKILGGTTIYLFLENTRELYPSSIFLIDRGNGSDFDLKIHANGQEVTCSYRK